METDFQCQRLTVRSHKTLATVGLLSAVLAIQTLAGTAMAGGSYEPPKRSRLAPLINAELPSKIPGEYIIVFKPGTPRDVVLAAQNRAKRLGGTIKHIYTLAPIGFSAKLPERALQALRTEPSVAYMENNQEGAPNIAQPPDPNSPPPTGLARTSKRLLPLPNPLSYTYSESGLLVNDERVHVYVIDSGIDPNHSEFKDSMGNTRVSGGWNVVSNNADSSDCSGHGTAMAGTIGGKNLGVAKEVALHPVRATNCSSYNPGDFIAAFHWVRDHKLSPAVVNLSVNFINSPSLETAVRDLVTNPSHRITTVISAGNGNGADVCSIVSPVSPANVQEAITVGAVQPDTDTRWPGSNIGPCLDLFAPGQDILTAMPDNKKYVSCTQASTTPGSMTQKCGGTSIAAPHVTGVVARILSRSAPNNPLPSPTPQAVWNALHHANNIYGQTAGWLGVIEPTTSMPITGSPNELLHYGSLSEGYNDGDPHITTVNGIHYDFQNAGEFVALRDANGMEIQTRQTPVPGAEHVSINTAIAARVGKHRVTWQPQISGVFEPGGLQLRVDGVLTTIGANGLDLGNDGRVMMSGEGPTLEINFPDGTASFVTAHPWAERSLWFLNVRVFHTPATEGIMGDIEDKGWEQPQFGEAWRVNDQTTLFDYPQGVSTKALTPPDVPKEKIPSIQHEVMALAKRVCEANADRDIDQNMLMDCAYDMAVTGDPIFAKSLRIAQRIQRGATATVVSANSRRTLVGEPLLFTATVTRHERGGVTPSGKVMFMLDGKPTGDPLLLDANGQARWKMRRLMIGDHRITARYIPDKNSVFLPSSSLDKQHTVEKRRIPHRDAGPKKHYEQ